MTGDRTPTPAEHFAGLADSECGEHRTVGVRAWCYRDGEWCSPYAPCRGCELPALRQRAEEAERERDTAREALDAAAIVITSLRDQRDEQRQRADKAERRVEHFEEHAAQVDADLGIETHRAETAERKLQQALDQIATERRGRLAAEAAARRAHAVIDEALPDWEDARAYHRERADRKGYSHDEAVAETSERAIKVMTAVLAALDAEETR